MLYFALIPRVREASSKYTCTRRKENSMADRWGEGREWDRGGGGGRERLKKKVSVGGGSGSGSRFEILGRWSGDVDEEERRETTRQKGKDKGQAEKGKRGMSDGRRKTDSESDGVDDVLEDET